MRTECSPEQYQFEAIGRGRVVAAMSRWVVAQDIPKPMDCPIKGNISSKGERIYHMPGGVYYDRTKIDPAKAERWFCSEAEAAAAGWRPSKRLPRRSTSGAPPSS